MSLKTNLRQSSDVAILDLNGRLSLGEALAFGPGSGLVLSETIRELTKRGQKKILLNLAGVTHVDSSDFISWLLLPSLEFDMYGNCRPTSGKGVAPRFFEIEGDGFEFL